jgi:hypothetical protein
VGALVLVLALAAGTAACGGDADRETIAKSKPSPLVHTVRGG